MGHIMSASLNGDVMFKVQYYADVCNPVVETTITARVVNTNKFGILAECSIKTDTGDKHTVLEIIIAKNTNTLISEVNLQDIKTGDIVQVEVLGRKFELNDKKISIVGRIVKEKKNSKKTVESPYDDGASEKSDASDESDAVDSVLSGDEEDEKEDNDEDVEEEVEGDVDADDDDDDAEEEVEGEEALDDADADADADGGDEDAVEEGFEEDFE
jgi:hypothetical protein